MSARPGLSYLHVVEYSRGVGTALCGRLLAEHGAEVVKVEPLGDAPRLPEAARLCFDAGKRSVTLTLEQENAREPFRRLLSWADVFIEDVPPSERPQHWWAQEQAHYVNTRLIRVSITPFGLEGPLRAWRTSDLVACAMSGLAWLTPDTLSDPDTQPPLVSNTDLAGIMAGLTASVLVMLGLASRGMSGRGRHFDLSLKDAILQDQCRELMQVSLTQPRPQVRTAEGSHHFGAGGMTRCKDGLVKLFFPEDRQWKRVSTLMGQPEWAEAERFRERALRARHWPEIETALTTWTMQHTRAELVTVCQRGGVPCAPVQTVADLAIDAHLRARGAVVDGPLAPGRTVPFVRSPLVELRRPLSPAPQLGQHNNEVFTTLGYSAGQIDDLRARGVT